MDKQTKYATLADFPARCAHCGSHVRIAAEDRDGDGFSETAVAVCRECGTIGFVDAEERYASSRRFPSGEY